VIDMKMLRKIIEIDEELCNGCGQCVPSCAEGAIQIIDGKARLVAERYCDGLGACLGECPTGALKIVEREAEEFDEEAVEEYLRQQKIKEQQSSSTLACGCPSERVEQFTPLTPCQQANRPVEQKDCKSALSHWPVQIRLVPPSAPFLKGADLLVAADCTPVAYPRFHEDLLRGKVVLLGCPKFDNAHEYVAKFKEIFESADIRSVTNLIMEVPCCSALPVIVQKGMEEAGKDVPIRNIVVSTRGELLTPLENQ